MGPPRPRDTSTRSTATRGQPSGSSWRNGGLRRALYAGDDTTDLDAFRGLDGLELAVRIAVGSDEGPDELGPAADLVVDGPEGLAAVLARL